MSWPAHCFACGRPIDLPELHAYQRAGREYVHACGRVLIQPRKHETRPNPGGLRHA